MWLFGIILCSCTFWNQLDDDDHCRHYFGEFPNELGYSEGKWSCEGRWIGSRARSNSPNDLSGKYKNGSI